MATQTPVSGPQLNYCWSYDSFGNRLTQATSSSPFTGTLGADCSSRVTGTLTGNAWVHINGNNQVTASSLSVARNSLQPDASGNMTNDGINQYLYDAEGRICAMQALGSSTGAVGYLYNAEGQRVAKGTLSQFSCNLATTTFTVTSEYLKNANGEPLTEFDGQGVWVRTDVFAEGQILASYENDGQGTHFHFTDWLGTRRVQTDYLGDPEVQCQGGVFGDALSCSPLTGSASDATPIHFTGKERDTESGNDYFGARYYASSMGRFLSPDWYDDPAAIPYADTSNPQSLNLYSYAGNNPVANSDDDGHDCIYNNGDGTGYVQTGDCTNAGGVNDSGIYINGTVDANSFQYNANNNSSSFSYTTDSGGMGFGTIQGPDLNGGFDPGSLGAAVFGSQNASTWKNAAGAVNAAGGLEASLMAPWAVAAAQCPGQSKGACAASMAFALLPFGLEGAAAKDLKAISGVLKMIDSGTTKGQVFMNLEGKLPAAAEGYYREFTVPLAGQSGRGASRIVTGANGEAYYTADHYTTFTRIR